MNIFTKHIGRFPVGVRIAIKVFLTERVFLHC